MKEYISKNSSVIFVLAIAVFLGAFVRVWNLSDGRFLDPDGYGSITSFLWSKYPFLNLANKVPVFLWGRYPDVTLYTNAFWGTLSIAMVFVIASFLFNDKVGAYSALILSLFALHVSFSRQGLAAIFQSFLLLVAFLLFSLYLKDNKQRYVYIVLTGVFLGLAFLTYVTSYAAIVTLFLLLPIILKFQDIPFKRICFVTAILGCSSLMVIILFEIINRINANSYFYMLFVYQQRTAKFTDVAIGKANLSALLGPFRRVSAAGGALQLWLIIIGIIYCIIDWLLKRDKQLFLLTGFICLNYLVLSIMCLSAVHTMYAKRFVYLIPFLCVSSGYLIHKIELVTNKYLVIIFLVIFSLLSFPKAYKFTGDTFKIKPITEWLKQRKIGKDKIVTALDIYERGDPLKATPMPGEYTKYPYSGFKIDWEKINELYQEEGIRYILTSGIGSKSSVGRNDQALKKSESLKSWVHPYHLKHPENKEVQDFALYELEDILPLL